MNRSLVAILVLLAVMIPGCGAGDPLAALDLAVDRTKDVDSTRQTITMKTEMNGEKMVLEGEGTSTADNKDGELTATIAAGGTEFEFEAIVVDGTVYMKSDAVPLPAGKEWIKSPDLPPSSLDPAEFVQHLREAQGVKNVGSEEIRGEPTTHFSGLVDLEKLVEASFGNDMLEQFKRIPNVHEYNMTIDVWVLEDGLPARLAMKITAPEHVSGDMTLSTDFLEYDVPVDVEAPPADKVIEESELDDQSS